MFVRLAFTAAINVDPEILIVDEALAVGDASFQRKCLRKFSEFQEIGKTILMVTHDLQLSVQETDRFSGIVNLESSCCEYQRII